MTTDTKKKAWRVASKAGKKGDAIAAVKGRRLLLRTFSEPVPAGKGKLWYPTEDVKQKVKRTFKPKTAKLRKSITPGTVLIMLQGRFAGKRVVFLKQLDSGLLLVTGPYSVNKVPLRRVDQTAVIATSTKLKITVPDLSACTDKEFSAKASRSARASTLKAAGKDKFFETAKETAVVSKERAALQATVDAAITKALAPDVTAYLKSKFKLSQGQRPHEMIF